MGGLWAWLVRWGWGCWCCSVCAADGGTIVVVIVGDDLGVVQVSYRVEYVRGDLGVPV